MKQALVVTMTILLAMGLILGTASASETEQTKAEPKPKTETKPEKTEQKAEAKKETSKVNLPKGKEYVVMELKDGLVVIELYRDVAPKTVDNFIKLVNDGFYNGLNFHRVMEGFMAQGGCPQGTGTGGPGYQIKAEFSDKQHVRGTVSMARSNHPDSAGSQFFICFKPAAHLNGQYTVFGQVIEGMEHVDALKKGAPGSGVVKDPDKMLKLTYHDKRK
jgi:peptidylprolyl isomerase